MNVYFTSKNIYIQHTHFEYKYCGFKHMHIMSFPQHITK